MSKSRIHKVNVLTLICGGALLAACGGDFSLGRSQQVDVFQQAESVEVDVLFVIDNSSSMEGAQEKAIAAFDDFVGNLEQIESEWHIGITTTDVSDSGAQGTLIPTQVAVDSDTGEETVLSRYVTWETDNYQEALSATVRKAGLGGDVFEAGLQATSLALLPESRGGKSDTDNAGFVRPEAKLAVVWISDEDDCSQDGSLPLDSSDECYLSEWSSSLVPPQQFVEDLLSLKPQDEFLVFGAIVGVKYQSENCLVLDPDTGEPELTDKGELQYEAVAIGDRYIAAVNSVGGIIADICQSDFADIFETLGISASAQRSEFSLNRIPDVDTLEVYVTPLDEDTVQIPMSQGWTYAEEANAVIFYGNSIPARGANIEIRYDVVG